MGEVSEADPEDDAVNPGGRNKTGSVVEYTAPGSYGVGGPVREHMASRKSAKMLKGDVLLYRQGDA